MPISTNHVIKSVMLNFVSTFLHARAHVTHNYTHKNVSVRHSRQTWAARPTILSPRQQDPLPSSFWSSDVLCSAWLSLCRPLMHAGTHAPHAHQAHTHTCVRAASGCVFSGNIINGVCLGCRKHLPTALSENRRVATPPHLPPLKQPEDFSRAPCLERLQRLSVSPDHKLLYKSRLHPHTDKITLPLFLCSILPLCVLSSPPLFHLPGVKVCLD